MPPVRLERLRKAAASRRNDPDGATVSAVSSVSSGPFPSEVSRCASLPICEARPCGLQEEVFSCAHPATNSLPAGSRGAEQLWDVYLQRPHWAFLAEALSRHFEAAGHVFSSMEFYYVLPTPRSENSGRSKSSIFAHAFTGQLPTKRETFRLGAE